MKTALLIVLLSSFLWADGYKETSNPRSIQRLSDSAFIPVSPDNKDYWEFLKWQKEGGVILPADPIVIPIDVNSELKAQALTDAKDKGKTAEERLDALIKAVGL